MLIQPASLDYRGLPSYRVDGDALAMGASLGNNQLWVTTKGTGAIERVFHTRTGAGLFGSISIRYGRRSSPMGSRENSSDDSNQRAVYSTLRPDGLGVFDIHPAFQRRRFSLAASIGVSETTFVPVGTRDDGVDPAGVYQRVELENQSDAQHALRACGFARLRGTLAPDVSARYDAERHALVAHGVAQERLVRCYGLTREPTSYATMTDFGRVYDQTDLHPLDGSTSKKGDILGALQYDFVLGPHEKVTFGFVCSCFDGAEADALRDYSELPPYEDALDRTISYLSHTLRTSEVLTPDPGLNEGVLWSKVNMRRVMACYPMGDAFTNEPGVSSNVVGRDAGWFVYGNDHFMPEFSRALLDRFADVQLASGKIPEYYNALDGTVSDDGLNINDDTPLFILAVNHHARATGDAAWLERIYAGVSAAARYIVTQIDARGLVVNTTRDPRGNVWGICGWRNVIPGYELNGAVTEINAECAAALRAAAHLAEQVGNGPEAAAFRASFERIKAGMDEHLRNPDNGLYYLNIDLDGTIHSDVTGDEVFPVLFRICDEDTGFRIIRRLNAGDFWTRAGLRTVSRDDPFFDPTQFAGLLGGVWPGLTWWYAFAAARYHPDFMVVALTSSFAHYSADPKTNNTVPGQFSEYFDGESLINRGMRLSPWEPPRYLWAAVEGVCGLMLTNGAPRINPLLPLNWHWVALRRLPYHGKEISYFVIREEGLRTIYATCDVDAADDVKVKRFDIDVSSHLRAFSESAVIVALQRSDLCVVLIANIGKEATLVPLNLSSLLDGGCSRDFRIFDSERGGWDVGRCDDHSLSTGLWIESNGYRLLKLRTHPRGREAAVDAWTSTQPRSSKTPTS